MNERNVLIHLLGIILSISAILHSFDNYWTVLIIIPYIIVSISVELEFEKISIISLVAGTLITPFFINPNFMVDFIPITIFIITFIIPVIVYWILVLSPTINFNRKGIFLTASYFGLSIIMFYSVIFIFNISDYILAEENAGPQALVLISSALLAMIPYHIWLTFKD